MKWRRFAFQALVRTDTRQLVFLHVLSSVLAMWPVRTFPVCQLTFSFRKQGRISVKMPSCQPLFTCCTRCVTLFGYMVFRQLATAQLEDRTEGTSEEARHYHIGNSYSQVHFSNLGFSRSKCHQDKPARCLP